MNAQQDPASINAVVVLTDGRNEYTDNDLDRAARDLQASAQENGVRVFTIAYGPDADLATLQEISEASRAAAYDARNPATHRQGLRRRAVQLLTRHASSPMARIHRSRRPRARPGRLRDPWSLVVAGIGAGSAWAIGLPVGAVGLVGAGMLGVAALVGGSGRAAGPAETKPAEPARAAPRDCAGRHAADPAGIPVRSGPAGVRPAGPGGGRHRPRGRGRGRRGRAGRRQRGAWRSTRSTTPSPERAVSPGNCQGRRTCGTPCSGSATGAASC